jgi:phage shock protein C
MEPKRLFRSRNERMLGGVCGGFGKYMNMDPVLIRLIWAVLFFFGGIGLLFYILCWIIIPEEPIVTNP